MGDLAAKSWGYPGKPPTTVDQSVQGILQVVSGYRYLVIPGEDDMDHDFLEASQADYEIDT